MTQDPLCLIFGFLLIFLTTILVRAVLLRAACHFLGEPIPEFGHAISVAFLQMLAEGGIVLGVHFAVVLVFGADIEFLPVLALVAPAVGYPLGILAASGINALMLNVSFAKGIGLYWLQVLILFLIAATLFVALALPAFICRSFLACISR